MALPDAIVAAQLAGAGLAGKEAEAAAMMRPWSPFRRSGKRRSARPRALQRNEARQAICSAARGLVRQTIAC